jgi:hypothetical protein
MSIIKQVVKEATVTEGTLLGAFDTIIDMGRGAAIGATGGFGLGVAGSILGGVIFWALGLTNPITAIGLGVFGAAKLGLASGLIYGSYKGYKGELEESVQTDKGKLKKQFITMSEKAIELVHKRDEMLNELSKKKDPDESIIRSYDKKYEDATRKIVREFMGLKQFASSNKQVFDPNEFKVIMKLCDLGIKGKITYAKVK